MCVCSFTCKFTGAQARNLLCPRGDSTGPLSRHLHFVEPAGGPARVCLARRPQPDCVGPGPGRVHEDPPGNGGRAGGRGLVPGRPPRVGSERLLGFPGLGNPELDL